ncbi:MAG TPA: 5'/3'-nucleotidase SurE [Nitrospiria bacterium]|nr:5'/3'-nucleotidase SurE [Nitrospiria bacterium]
MRRKSVRILVSNDDGVHSRGLHILAAALKEIGEIYVVAPDRVRNAAGHALTLHKPLRVEQLEERVFSVSGTPTDCINLGIRIMKGKPLLVVAGINKGENLGDDVTYSGTVSAAMEGTLLGIPSFSISISGEGDYHFDVAARFAQQLASQILKKGLPRDTLLNVNVPDLPKEKIQGVKFTCLGKRVYEDVIVEKVDPRGKKYYWIAGNRIVFEGRRNTDFEALQAGKISVTPLKLDLTDYKTLARLKSWESLLEHD